MSGSEVRGAGIAAKDPAVANAAKQSLRDAKAAKTAVLHIQQNEPLTQKQQREAMLDSQQWIANLDMLESQQYPCCRCNMRAPPSW